MMNMIKLSIAGLVMAVLIAEPAFAQKGRRVEQDAAYEATREGAVKPLRSIENGIVPQMKARGADYIGQEFEPASKRYRLKFMRGSSVIWVDVDGRNGNIIGKAGE
jgi:hypothetical protein